MLMVGEMTSKGCHRLTKEVVQIDKRDPQFLRGGLDIHQSPKVQEIEYTLLQPRL